MLSSFIAGHSFSEFWASLCKATYSTRERNSCCDKVLFLLLFFGGLFCGVHFRGDQLIFLLCLCENPWNTRRPRKCEQVYFKVNVVKIHCPYLPVLIKTYHKKVCPNLYIYLLYFVVYKRHLIYVYVHVQLHVSRLFHVAIVYFK
jgi:hypothetical protein